MDILVTGGAGYIGSHTVRKLIGAGHKVTVIDDLSTGNPWAVDEKAQFYRLALENRAAVREILKEHTFDAIMHLAAFTDVPESIENPRKYYFNNTINTQNLYMDAQDFGVKSFIFSSTAAVYGDVTNHPVTEDRALAPINPYGHSKKLAEDFIRAFSTSSDVNFVILRYFNVAGACVDGLIGQSRPGDKSLFSAISKVAHGLQDRLAIFGTDYPTPDGTCIRDFIHVEDVAGAHVSALDYLNEGGCSETMNIGYGHGYSVRQVLNTYELSNKVKIASEVMSRRLGDPANVVADNQKILNLTNWAPEYDDLSLICKSAHHWEQKLLNAREG